MRGCVGESILQMRPSSIILHLISFYKRLSHIELTVFKLVNWRYPIHKLSKLSFWVFRFFHNVDIALETSPWIIQPILLSRLEIMNFLLKRPFVAGWGRNCLEIAVGLVLLGKWIFWSWIFNFNATSELLGVDLGLDFVLRQMFGHIIAHGIGFNSMWSLLLNVIITVCQIKLVFIVFFCCCFGMDVFEGNFLLNCFGLFWMQSRCRLRHSYVIICDTVILDLYCYVYIPRLQLFIYHLLTFWILLVNLFGEWK